jgi:hypothetical protein
VDVSVPDLDLGNIDNINFAHSDSQILHVYPEFTLSHNFDIQR